MPGERKSGVLLQHHLKQLKLPIMLKEYPLLEAREDRQLQRLLTQLQNQDLLILDEDGSLRP